MAIQTETAWVHVPVRRKWRNTKASHSHPPKPQTKRCKIRSNNSTKEARTGVDISSHVCSKCAVHEQNWLTEESREYVAWDGFHEKGSRRYALTSPPGLAMSKNRVEKGVLPPSFDIPSLPAVLPQTRGSRYTKQNSTPIMWPHMPGAPTLALSLKECIEDVDIVAGASLFYALWGHSRYIKEKYLLQRCANGTVIVIHLPKHKRSDSQSPGHLSEAICCPGKLHNRIHFSIGKLRVGNIHMTTISEVDGFMTDLKRPVEIKTRKKTTIPDMKDTIQASVNGSEYLAQFKLSSNERMLESVQLFRTTDLQLRHDVAWQNAGQRICVMLQHILSNELVMSAYNHPVMLTFDQVTREPLIANAQSSFMSIIPL